MLPDYYIYIYIYIYRAVTTDFIRYLYIFSLKSHFFKIDDIYIYMERYNKSTMPVNAAKIFYDPPWDSNSRPRQHRLALYYPLPLPTALSRQPKKDCSNSADIGIGKCSTRRILGYSLCVASISFANKSPPDSENTSEIR